MPHDRSTDPRLPGVGPSPGSSRRRRPRRVATALAVAAALALGACGSDDGDAAAAGDRTPEPGRETATAPPGTDQPTPTGSADPCALLEESEIEEQFGGAVAPGVGSQSLCRWAIDDGGPDDPAVVDLAVVEVPKGMSVDDAWAEMLEAEPEDRTDRGGVGDAAFVVDNGYAGRSLTVRSGDAVLIVSARFIDPPPDTDEKLTALAERMIERL